MSAGPPCGRRMQRLPSAAPLSERMRHRRDRMPRCRGRMRWRDLLPSYAVSRSAFPRKRNGARLIGKRWNWGLRLAGCCAALFSLAIGGPPVSSESAGWIYMREGVPPQPGERFVEVLAVGDVMLGRGMADVEDVFAEVAGELQGADLTIGNLEGAVGTQPAAGVGIPLLLPPEAPARLAAAGFDLLSLANNHSLDAGTSGLGGMRVALQAVGIRSAGERTRRHEGGCGSVIRLRRMERSGDPLGGGAAR